jgi:hypothetical protein
MHIDEGAHSFNVNWATQPKDFKGGEFVFPSYGIYFVPDDNMLWWFDQSQVHGTALIADDNKPRWAIGSSVPSRLKKKVERLGINGLWSRASQEPTETATSSRILAPQTELRGL